MDRSPLCQQMCEKTIEVFKSNVLQRKIRRDLHFSPLTEQNIMTPFQESAVSLSWTPVICDPLDDSAKSADRTTWTRVTVETFVNL